MFITLYFIVTRLPDSLRSVRDHFLTLDPTSLTFDLLEQHLLAAETSAVAVGAARGTLRSWHPALTPALRGAPPPPFPPPSPLLLRQTSLFVRTSLLRLVRSAGTARARVAGVVEEAAVVVEVAVGVAVGAAVEEAEAVEVVAAVGLMAEVEALMAAVEAVEGVAAMEAVGPVVVGLDLSVEALVAVGASSSSVGARLRRLSSSVSAAAALGASASGTPPGTAPADALHTFTLDSGASRCFFRDSTTLTPFPAPVPVRLADPSGGPVVASSSTVLPCPAVPSGGSVRRMRWSLPPLLGVSLCRSARARRRGVTWLRSLFGQATERRIGLVMEVARTSLIHAAAPHFLWSFAVQYAAHQLNLWPRVSLPETSPTLLWTGEVGDASRFRVWGSRAFVRDTSADKLSSRAVPCVFIGFVPDAPGWQIYHATSRRVLPSQDVTFDESVPYYRLFPYRIAPLPPPRLSSSRQVDPVEPVEVAVDSCPAAGVEPGGAEPGGAEPGGAEPGDAESGGAEPGGAEPGGADPGGTESGGPEPWGAEPGGTEPGGTEPRSLESRGPESGGPVLESPAPGGALSSEQLREWYLQYCSLRRGTSGARRTTGAGASASPPRRELPSRDQIREWCERRCTLRSGAPGVTDPGAAGTASGAAGPGVGAAAGTEDPGVGAAAGAEDPGAGAAAGAVEPGVGAAAGTEDSSVGAATGAEDPGAGAAAGAVESGVGAAAGAGDPGVGAATGAEDPGVGAAAGAEDPGTGDSAGSRVAARRRPYFVPLLQQVLGLPPSTGPPPPSACPQPVQSQLELRPAYPLPALSPYTGPTGGLAEWREPASRPALPVRTARTSGCGSRLRPPPVPGTHRMSLRLSTAPLRAPLPSPLGSSLPALSDPESDSLRAASPTVTRLLATAVTDPSFESSAASALVTELVDFAARCRLNCAASLDAESESVCPPSVGGECALGTDVLEDRQEEFQCLAAASPHLVSVLLTPEGDLDALDIPTPRSYAEAIEGPYSSQWQAAMDAEMASWKSTGTYVDAVPPSWGEHRQWHVDFQGEAAAGFSACLQGALRGSWLHLHEEIWLRRPPRFTGTSPPGTQWSLRRPVYGLSQAPREWHDTLRTTLAALGFAPSTADPSLFLRTDTSLPLFYILVYVDDLVFATADTAGLAHVKSELQKRHTCTDLGELRSYLGLQITQDRARRTITLTQSHMVQQVLQRFGFTYSSPQATPLPTRHSLSALPSDESVESSGPYPELVGCLMYLMTCTRPDLAYPLSILAHYVAPGRHRPEHMTAAKRVLRYLCSTSGMGLVLGGQSPVVLSGHADASWADDQATQRSSQGYTFSLGSGSVSWRATRSSSVLGSSCEAEIYAGAMAAQELRWLTYLLTDLGEPPRSPPVLYVDNKAMLALCREQRLEHRTKHIALRYFLARELQASERGHVAQPQLTTLAACVRGL
ncbi:unnamed protein product [Closterium sp. NIES-54]